ncbi:unnamed protein product [Camellia sinensis]
MSDSDSQFGSFRSALQSESPPLHSDDNTPAVKATSPVVVSNLSMREEMAATVAVVEGDFGGGGGVEDVAVEEEKRGRSRREGVEEIRGRGRRRRREVMVKRAELGIRVWEVIVCLISFSVMVTDKTRGWSGDSFDRYKEYRYCAAVSVIGFVYSGLQACHLCYDLITQKHAANFHHLRCYFDFAMDQVMFVLKERVFRLFAGKSKGNMVILYKILTSFVQNRQNGGILTLSGEVGEVTVIIQTTGEIPVFVRNLRGEILAYLMISASSSAATRVDDWVSNWGKDQFANIATVSIGMSFLAFAAFAISSLISGYNFCHQSAAAA